MSRFARATVVMWFALGVSLSACAGPPERGETLGPVTSHFEQSDACADGAWSECFALAQGIFEDVRLPDRLGIDVLRWVCEEGGEATCRRSGEILWSRGERNVARKLFGLGCQRGDRSACRRRAHAADQDASGAQHAQAYCEAEGTSPVCHRLDVFGWRSEGVRRVTTVGWEADIRPEPTHLMFEPKSSRPVLSNEGAAWRVVPAAEGTGLAQPRLRLAQKTDLYPKTAAPEIEFVREAHDGQSWLAYKSAGGFFASSVFGDEFVRLQEGDRHICRVLDIEPVGGRVLAVSAATERCERAFELAWWDLESGKPTGANVSFGEEFPAGHVLGPSGPIVVAPDAERVEFRSAETLAVEQTFEHEEEVAQVEAVKGNGVIHYWSRPFSEAATLWRVSNGKRVKLADDVQGDIAVSPDHSLFAVIGDQSIRWLDASTGEERFPATRHFTESPGDLRARFSPDGCRLYVYGSGVRVVELSRRGGCGPTDLGESTQDLAGVMSAMPRETLRFPGGGVIRGTLTTSSGEPVEGAQVTAGLSHSGYGDIACRSTRTDEGGDFSFDELDQTVWKVSAESPYGTGIYSVEAEPGASRRSFELEDTKIALSGRVVDSDGQPVEGATVMYVTGDRYDADVSDLTGANGGFRFEGLEGDGGDIIAYQPEGTFAQQRVELPYAHSTETHGPIELELSETDVVGLRVVEANGRPIEGVVIDVEALSGWDPDANWSTGPRGYWIAPVERAGRFRITAESPSQRYSTQRTLDVPTTEPATIEFPNARLMVRHPTRLVDWRHPCRAEYEPHHAAYVRRRGASEADFREGKTTGRGTTFERLEAGTWVIWTANDRDDRWERRYVTLKSGESRTIEPELGKEGRDVVGRVVSARSGIPLGGLEVATRRLGEVNHRDLPKIRTETDADGHFRLENLAPAERTIFVETGVGDKHSGGPPPSYRFGGGYFERGTVGIDPDIEPGEPIPAEPRDVGTIHLKRTGY